MNKIEQLEQRIEELEEEKNAIQKTAEILPFTCLQTAILINLVKTTKSLN